MSAFTSDGISYQIMRSKHGVVFVLFTNHTIENSEFRVLDMTGQETAQTTAHKSCAIMNHFKINYNIILTNTKLAFLTTVHVIYRT